VLSLVEPIDDVESILGVVATDDEVGLDGTVVDGIVFVADIVVVGIDVVYGTAK
jgi:hypothetical protein